MVGRITGLAQMSTFYNILWFIVVHKWWTCWECNPVHRNTSPPPTVKIFAWGRTIPFHRVYYCDYGVVVFEKRTFLAYIFFPGGIHFFNRYMVTEKKKIIQLTTSPKKNPTIHSTNIYFFYMQADTHKKSTILLVKNIHKNMLK